MKKYDYFEVPTQVQFWDYTYRRYHGGIAYKNEIICGYKRRCDAVKASKFWDDYYAKYWDYNVDIVKCAL